LAATGSLHAEENVEQLIDQLAKVSKPGIGYSRYWYGTEFLPYDDTARIDASVWWAGTPSHSETLCKIVAQGAKAIPVLLKYLDDDRKIAAKPVSGFPQLASHIEYDYNSCVRDIPFQTVNLKTYSVYEKNSYLLTVGDLCFIALGQIVNREFSVARFQPRNTVIISSPVHSEELQKVIREDWSNFTTDKHRHLLIEDFKNPDHEDRQIGAYLRLSFYYPEVIEPLVLNEFQQPVYKALETYQFCHNVLYKTFNSKQRKKLYDQFVREHGNQYIEGIKTLLLFDLRLLELDESGQLTPPLAKFKNHPRELLIQLFSEPKDVKSTKIAFVHARTEYERSLFIRALTHDKSEKISDRVKELFLETPDNEVLAPAYLFCLAKRGGNGDFLVEQLAKIDLFAEKTNPLHLQYLESICASKEPTVQRQLLRIVETTTNYDYFMKALSGLVEPDKKIILENAERILSYLPLDSPRGGDLLRWVTENCPEKAARFYLAFLTKGKAENSSMSNVLLYTDPSPLKIPYAYSTACAHSRALLLLSKHLIDQVEKMADDLSKKLLNTPPEELLDIEKMDDYEFKFQFASPGNRGDIINKDIRR
jgi:hypothetical protein